MNKYIKIVLLVVVVFSVLFVTACVKKEENKEQVVNPLYEMKSLDSLQKKVGYKIPDIEKEVDKYYYVSTDSMSHARIIYSDFSILDIEKSSEDISGIYGGLKESVETIDDVEVTVYSLEDTIYAIWNKDTLSYSYSMKNASKEQLLEDIKIIVSKIQ